MANPLFNAIFGGSQPFSGQGSTLPTQTPGTAQNASCGQQMTMQDAMAQLQANPAQMIRQRGFNVPDEIAGNPQATVMHLIQSGQVGGQMMQRIQPMLNMLMGRR